MFLNGAIAGQCAFIYVYAASFLKPSHIAAFSIFFLAYDAITIFTQAFYYSVISNNSRYYYEFVIVECTIIAVLGHFFGKENQ
jgi:hypothetical protein